MCVYIENQIAVIFIDEQHLRSSDGSTILNTPTTFKTCALAGTSNTLALSILMPIYAIFSSSATLNLAKLSVVVIIYTTYIIYIIIETVTPEFFPIHLL